MRDLEWNMVYLGWNRRDSMRDLEWNMVYLGWNRRDSMRDLEWNMVYLGWNRRDSMRDLEWNMVYVPVRITEPCALESMNSCCRRATAIKYQFLMYYHI